jgi:RNA polymerase sigma-70 factor (ECF subfamily)
VQSLPRPADSSIDDAELVRRIASHDATAFETVMRRNNSALYRVARAILKNDSDAEEVLQEAYLAAYRHAAEFRADAKLSTWLTRIVVNQALVRRRNQRRERIVVPFSDLSADERRPHESDAVDESADSPEHSMARAEVRRLLERKIDELPVAFRTVFVLREVDELSVAETAACLSIQEATVRSRLFRARGLLRESLASELDLATGDIFQFAGERCDRVVAGVLARLRIAAEASCRESGDANVGREL